jgi:hypothetical protein
MFHAGSFNGFANTRGGVDMGNEQKSFAEKAEGIAEGRCEYRFAVSAVESALRAEWQRGYGNGFDAGRVYQKQIEPGAVPPTEGEA